MPSELKKMHETMQDAEENESQILNVITEQRKRPQSSKFRRQRGMSAKADSSARRTTAIMSIDKSQDYSTTMHDSLKKQLRRSSELSRNMAAQLISKRRSTSKLLQSSHKVENSSAVETFADELCKTSASNFSENYNNFARKLRVIQRGCQSFKELQLG